MKKKTLRIIALCLAAITLTGVSPYSGVSFKSANDDSVGKIMFLSSFQPPVVGSIPISTRAELEAIKNNISGFYHLTQDIDLSGEDWTPIGDVSTRPRTIEFTGIFDGQGYEIRNLTVIGDFQSVGLFSRLSKGAIVKNTGLVDLYIDVSSFSDSVRAGGLAGSADESTISNSFTSGYISVSASAIVHIGGIVGYTSNTVISSCYNTGSVYSSSSSSVNIPSFAYTGGISGVSHESVISNCYNTGDISASSISNISSAGGISGNSSNSTIESSYNTGSVSAFSNDVARTGGIAIANSTSLFPSNSLDSRNYWRLESVQMVNGNQRTDVEKTSDGGWLRDADMKDATSYAGFDFKTIWDISPEINNGYPFLRENPPLNNSQAPTITSANRTTVPYTGGVFQVVATGASPIYYSLSGQPPGVIIDSDSGLITVTETTAIGTYNFVITATNGIDPDASQNFTLIVDAVPNHGISLSATGTHTFPEQNAGYRFVTPLQVYVTNIGNQTIDSLNVTITGENRGSFTPSTNILSNVRASEDTDFMVIPNNGLLNGRYMATVMVTGSDGIVASFDVIFTVGNGSSGNYGSNGRFLAPIGAPVAGSIPISNRADLETVRNNLSANYHLTQDIDLSDAEWTPIGDNATGGSASRYTGIFDGQGYVIRNLTITREWEYVGLFGAISDGSIVRNVGLEDLHINASANYAGGISGSTGYSTISNCYSTGSIHTSSSSSSFSSYVGGITGSSFISATIINSYNTSSVTASSDVAISGGIIGYSFSAAISNCYNTGVISAASYLSSGGANAGGISGYSYTYSNIPTALFNCYNTGTISAFSARYAYAAGISGYCSYDTTVSSCYNTGNVFAATENPISDNRAHAGGISGYSHSTINNCYNAGDISAESASDDSFCGSHAGGISAYSYAEIKNCFNTGAVSASSSSSTHRSWSSAGGVTSFSSNSDINNCYNAGNLSASSTDALSNNGAYVGGIAGYSASSPLFENIYWRLDSDQIVDGIKRIDTDKRIDGFSFRSTGNLTDVEMKSVDSFVGFDFETVWEMISGVNNGFPKLRMFTHRPSSWAMGEIERAIATELVPLPFQSNYTLATTRLEFATLAVALYEHVTGFYIQYDSGLYSDTNDVNALKAAAIGVTTGTGDGSTFSPDVPLTREQAATMLSRLASALGAPLPQHNLMFADRTNVSAYAIEAVGQMEITGTMGSASATEHVFLPKEPYTREQSIVTIMRLYDFIV